MDVERPGYFGKERSRTFASYDQEYGRGNWRLTWKWGNLELDFMDACLVYEDGYYHDSFKREDVWRRLQRAAKDVYDIEERDIHSKCNYRIQQGRAVHIQDIAIRRVFRRRGWEFEGDDLIQIRHEKSCLGNELSPGAVPFHEPEMIKEPHIVLYWCKDNTVEVFYQSNKTLQVRKRLSRISGKRSKP